MTTGLFKIVNEFIGCGPSHAPIWFIGIEEAHEWSEDPEKDREQYEKYVRGRFPEEVGTIKNQAEKEGRQYTKIYDIMTKLVIAIESPDRLNFAGWKEYRNGKLLQAHDIVFQANLFPLGKKSDAGGWPTHYKKLFGLGKEDRAEYEHIVRRDRFPLLRSAWQNDAPVITVCFGLGKWDLFEELLRPSGASKAFDNCKVYEKSGIVLTPFFKYRFMPHSLIHKLAEKVRPLWQDREHFNNLRADGYGI